MKYQKLISEMTLEEKCYLFSGKDFWQSRSIKRLGVPNMTMSDGPHGIRKQEGAGDQFGLNGDRLQRSAGRACIPAGLSDFQLFRGMRELSAAEKPDIPQPWETASADYRLFSCMGCNNNHSQFD